MRKFGITFATLLIAIAITILLSIAGILPCYIISIAISWQSLIVLAGLKTILLRSYLLGASIVAVGAYFLIPSIYVVIGEKFPFNCTTWNAIAAVVALVLLAILVIRISSWIPNIKGIRNIEPNENGTMQVCCAFGKIEHTIIEQPYNSMKTVSAFGQLELDMTKTALKEGNSYLEVNNAFGSTIVIIPENWSVTLSVHSFLGEVKDCRANKSILSDRRLTIKGANAFGDVTIINKLIESVETYSKKEMLESISVKHNNRIFIISLEQLLYIQADGDYVTLCTSEGNFLKEQTMKYFQNNLPADRFLRTHRSYIVNVSEISSVDNRGREIYYVTLKNGTTLRASANGYQELKQRLEL